MANSRTHQPLDAEHAPAGSDAQLVPWLADRPYEANTNLSRDQFVEEQHLRLRQLEGSGLDVDVVPFSTRAAQTTSGTCAQAHP